MYRQFILILLFPVFVFADQVMLQDGTKYEGKITSADQDYIYLQLADLTSTKIPRSFVKTVFFTYSDLLYLNTGEIIECKIVNQTITELIIVTGQGPSVLKIIDVKNYFFNAGDSLQIPVLLPTGTIFDNKEIFRKYKEISGKYILLGINAGITYVPATKWETSSMKGLLSFGFIKGLSLEYPLSTHLIAHLSYDCNEYSNNYNYYLPSLIKSPLILLGLVSKHPFSSPRNSYYSAGLGIGFNSLVGKSDPWIINFPDTVQLHISLKELGMKMAIKAHLETEVFITVRVVLRLQLSYLFAMPFDLEPGLDYDFHKKISLDFSGPALTLHLLYQIPLP